MTVSITQNISKCIVLDRNVTNFVKFLSCIGIALGHYAGYTIDCNMSNWFYRFITMFAGYTGVALFFFISGYGLMISEHRHHLGFTFFIKRRLFKTYLPAVFISVIWLGICNSIDDSDSKLLHGSKNWLLGVTWWFNDETLWFVRTILVLYLFFAVYISILEKSKKFHELPKYWDFFVLVVIGVTTTAIIKTTDIGDSLSVPTFFFGVAIAKWQNLAKDIFSSNKLLITIFLGLLIVTFLERQENIVLHGVINYFVICVLVAICSRYNVHIKRLPNWVGENSYNVYLVHYKTHRMLLFLFGIDYIWMFVPATALTTIAFCKLRKICRV